MSEYFWNNPLGGTFDVAGNWSPDSFYPVAGDNAEFLISGPFTVSGDGIASYLLISDDVTFTGVIDATGPVPPAFTSFEISGGDAVFDGGTLVASSEVAVGIGAEGFLTFVNGAAATLTATDSATALDVGFGSLVSGAVTVDGTDTSLTILGGFYVGVYGNGLLGISNGAVVQSVSADVGYDGFEVATEPDITGIVTVTSGATLAVGTTSRIGELGTGVASFTDGGVGQFGEYTVIGDGGSGTMSFAGGASGTFDGAADAANAIYLGGNGGSGTLSADGTATMISANEGMIIGQYGSGVVDLTNGATLSVIPASLSDPYAGTFLSETVGATGTVNVSGGAVFDVAQLYVGGAGYGSIDISSGGTVIDASAGGSAAVLLGDDAGSVGTGTVDAALWDSQQSFEVGYEGSGTLTVQDGGTLAVDNGNLRVARDLGASGTLSVDRAFIYANSATLTVGPAVDPGDGSTGGSGTLALQDYAAAFVNSATLAGLATGTGSIDVNSDSELVITGALDSGAGNTDITVENYGGIYAFGSIEVGGGGGPAYVGVTDHGGFYDYGSGLTIADLGTVAVGVSSYLQLGSTVTLDSGTLSALGIDTQLRLGIDVIGGTSSDPSAIVGVAGSDMPLTQGVTFAGAGSSFLLLGAAFDTGNVIDDFASGDTLDVRINSEVYNSASYDTSTGVLTLSAIQDAPLTLELADNGYSADSFSAFADGAGGTDVVLGPACYLAGTRILTDRGEVAVEDLAIGDRLVTHSGLARVLRWIGHRCYAGRFALHNASIQPVRIRAGALADSVPHRDLLVSPLHALYLDRVLVPADTLINGVSIVQCESIERVEYFHLELDTHDVILAEGAPAESFVDDDSRLMFHNAAEYRALYPTAPRRPAQYCAPRVTAGYRLAAIRERLAVRAGMQRSRPATPLRGFVDHVGADIVEGWAQNPTSPEVPVCLDIMIDGVLLGRVLANRRRPGLATATGSSGCHCFAFRLPGTLTPRQRALLEVRRSCDQKLLERHRHALAA